MTENKIWEEMEIPKELDGLIVDAVGEGHARLMRKRKKEHWRAATIAMATAAACFMAVAIGFTNPVVARAYSSIPVIGNIFAYLYDAADSEVPFAQVGEAAVPVEEPDGTEQENPGQQAGAVPGEETESEDPVRIAIKEYFCDGYSLYLSFEVVSEEPFLEGATDMAGKEGTIFLYSTESITTGTGESFRTGNGALKMTGVFRDEHTFAGIARSGGSLDGCPLTDKMQYELESSHMTVYADDMERDIEGKWKASAGIACTEGSLMTMAIGETIRGDVQMKEVRIQPYEIQVVIEEPKGASLAGEAVLIEAFDDQGRRLSPASQNLNRFVEDGEICQEIWMFERPTDAKKVTVFAVDEIKWLDEWKGYLYDDEPWSGQQMTEFLKENCFAYGEVELP